MRISENAYKEAQNGRSKFQAWIKTYLASNTDETAPYNLAADIAAVIPVQENTRKLFDKDAMHFVAEFPNLAFRTIQERNVELSDVDLVKMVSKNIILFSNLLNLEQKKRYRAARVRLPRVIISLNRNKLTEERFITLSAMHDLRRTNKDEKPLYIDYMYSKFMTQVLSRHMDVTGLAPKELWPYWLEFIDSYELT